MAQTLAHGETPKQHPSGLGARKPLATLHCLTCGFMQTDALGGRLAVGVFGSHICAPGPRPIRAKGVA